jgi:signal transduction histidine kinase
MNVQTRCGGGRGPLRRFAIPLLLFVLLATPLCAQDQTISQMVHTTWTGRDGAPLGIRALAQTPDGILWIASLKGLYSFDGLSFTLFQPSPGSPSIPFVNLRSLYVSRSDDLWVNGDHGPAVRIHKGQVTIYPLAGGAPNYSLDYLQQDTTGAMWAVATDRAIVRLGTDGFWHTMPAPIPEPGHISYLLIDTADTQWVVENHRLYGKGVEQPHFFSTRISAYFPPVIKEGEDGTLWIMAPVSTDKPDRPAPMMIQQVDSSGRLLLGPLDFADAVDFLPGRDGSLWVMDENGQLLHARKEELASSHPGRPIAISDTAKLGRGVAIEQYHGLMFEGNEGVWAGGLDGLERLARATLVPAIPGAPPGFWSNCVDSKGDVFISRMPRDLYEIRNERLERLQSFEHNANIYCGPRGTVYLIANGIATIRNGRMSLLPLLPGFTGYGQDYVFTGFLPLADASLIGVVGGTNAATGLWVFKNGKWSRFLPAEHFAETTGLFEDSSGDLYLGHINGDIHLLREGHLTTYPATSTGFGGVLGFARTTSGVFAYGTAGIGLIRQDNLQVIHFADSDYSKNVTGLIQSGDGDIWINSFDGIVRIPLAEVRAALTDPSHKVAATNLQGPDFKGPSVPLLFSSTAHAAPNGKLWFSTLNGVVSVDPNFIDPPHPPQLAIRAITADGLRPNAHAEFPPNVATLDAQYFGVNLADPRSVIYRYQLQGLDRDWQDVGHRTEAIYTHLRPGHYTFRVVASSGDGVWTPPVSAQFSVLPSFYQTWWFFALCALAGLLLLWLGITARVSYAAAAIRIRAEERADERIRIARDLHDTLLQGVQGLLLSFHVAAEQVPASHESKQALEKALSTADRIIVEGRNRVTRLRSENLSDAELKPSIEGLALDLNGTGPVEFSVERKGGKAVLQAHIVDEIFCVAREAITNAFRHSGASRMLVELDYQRRQFKLICRDNGCGFDPAALAGTANDGHWGLRGMAERAERIGGDFSCESRPGGGTAVCVSVPARQAYMRSNGFRLFSRSAFHS